MWQNLLAGFVAGFATEAVRQSEAEHLKQEYYRFLNEFCGVLDEVMDAEQTAVISKWIAYNRCKYDL